MRKFFQSSLDWFSGKTTQANQVELKAEVLVQVATAPLEPLIVVVEAAPEEAAPTAALTVVPTEPAMEIESVVEAVVEEPLPYVPPVEDGPAISILKRGPVLYAVCPHCEASWSLRERLYDPRTGRPAKLKNFDCPACEKSVSLPAQLI